MNKNSPLLNQFERKDKQGLVPVNWKMDLFAEDKAYDHRMMRSNLLSGFPVDADIYSPKTELQQFTQSHVK